MIPNSVFVRLKRPSRTVGKDKYGAIDSCRIQKKETLSTMFGIFFFFLIMEWNGMKLINNKKMKKNGLKIRRTFSSVFGGL